MLIFIKKKPVEKDYSTGFIKTGIKMKVDYFLTNLKTLVSSLPSSLTIYTPFV